MKSTLNNVLIFAAGAAIGSVATWYFVKTKYERIAQEEIDSVKEALTGHKYVGPQDSDEDKAVEQNDTPNEQSAQDMATEMANMVQKLGYHNYSDVEPTLIKREDVPKKEAETSTSSARVITPEEFGEEGYKLVELTLWADNVLTDDKNKRVQDVDALIGKDNLDRFGEYEPDALHVRNDEKKIDFEIVRDLKRYSDFFDNDSHQTEDE